MGRLRALPASGLAIIAFFAVALLPRATWPLIDPDVWWHIRAGEEVLQTGRVPRVDSWSLTAFGQPWTSQDWLSNVLLALGHRLGDWGWTLLSLGAAAMVVAAFAVLWSAVGVRQREAGWFGRVVWFSVALLLAGPVLGVRVQVIDLLLAAVVLWLLWRYLVDRRRRWPAFLPLVAVAWVNLHAGWVLLFLFGGAFIVGELADRALRRRLSPEPMQPRDLAWLAGCLVVSAAALALNPSGIDIYGYPAYTAGIGALADFVGEWQRASLDNLFGWLLLGFVLFGVITTIVLGRRTLRGADVLILLGVTAMSVIAIRFLLITGPIGAAIVAVHLPPALSRTSVGRASSPLLARLARPRSGALATVNASIAVVLLFIGIGLAFVRAMPASQHEEIAREFPVEAVHWLATHDAGSSIFNKYEWGGYLGLELPDQPIFIDGRADVYGDTVIREYVHAIGVDNPAGVFNRYRIDHVLIPARTPLGDWLSHEKGWHPGYLDSHVAIWIRGSPDD
jgi:hypothetical protein